MPFTHSFKVLFRHSFEQSLYLAFVLALAFGLSFVEDLFAASHRSPVLIYGAHYASIFALIVDLIAWGLLLTIGLYKLFTRPWGNEQDKSEVSI